MPAEPRALGVALCLAAQEPRSAFTVPCKRAGLCVTVMTDGPSVRPVTQAPGVALKATASRCPLPPTPTLSGRSSDPKPTLGRSDSFSGISVMPRFGVQLGVDA